MSGDNPVIGLRDLDWHKEAQRLERENAGLGERLAGAERTNEILREALMQVRRAHEPKMYYSDFDHMIFHIIDTALAGQPVSNFAEQLVAAQGEREVLRQALARIRMQHRNTGGWTFQVADEALAVLAARPAPTLRQMAVAEEDDERLRSLLIQARGRLGHAVLEARKTPADDDEARQWAARLMEDCKLLLQQIAAALGSDAAGGEHTMMPVTIKLGRYSLIRDMRFQQPVRILLASYTSIMGCVFEEEAHIDADEQEPEDIRLEFNRFEKGVTGNIIDTMLSATCYVMDTRPAPTEATE